MTENGFGPRRVNDKEHVLNISGYALPWVDDTNMPSLIRMHGSEDLFIPVFSTKQKLIDFATQTKTITYTNIKKIMNGREFLDSIPLWADEQTRFRIVIDPHQVEEHKFRYFEILRP